jgi:hypothetical protein
LEKEKRWSPCLVAILEELNVICFGDFQCHFAEGQSPVKRELKREAIVHRSGYPAFVTLSFYRPTSRVGLECSKNHSNSSLSSELFLNLNKETPCAELVGAAPEAPEPGFQSLPDLSQF